MFGYPMSDPKNIKNLRNFRNTKKRDYNCGGYALGCYSWVLPYYEQPFDSFFMGLVNFSWEKLCEFTDISVNWLISEFPSLLYIEDKARLPKDKEIIAFRWSSDGDFHFIVRKKNGVWYHKRGGTRDILTMPEEEVLSSCWLDRYDGPLVLFEKG